MDDNSGETYRDRVTRTLSFITVCCWELVGILSTGINVTVARGDTSRRRSNSMRLSCGGSWDADSFNRSMDPVFLACDRNFVHNLVIVQWDTTDYIRSTAFSLALSGGLNH